MENLQERVASIKEHHRLYEQLKPCVSVKMPYSTMGGTPCVYVKAVSYGKKKNELYLHLTDDIYPAEGETFDRLKIVNKELDKVSYPLFHYKVKSKELMDILTEKVDAFPHSREKGALLNGNQFLEMIVERKASQLFIQLSDDTLIPVEDVFLGFDWDRNKLFMTTEKVYTCSEEVMKQHIEVSEKFIKEAKKVFALQKKVKP